MVRYISYNFVSVIELSVQQPRSPLTYPSRRQQEPTPACYTDWPTRILEFPHFDGEDHIRHRRPTAPFENRCPECAVRRREDWPEMICISLLTYIFESSWAVLVGREIVQHPTGEMHYTCEILTFPSNTDLKLVCR